jgi:hypothetical protein
LIRPVQQALIVGFTCQMPFHELNTLIKREDDLPCPVVLAYDGLTLNMVL